MFRVVRKFNGELLKDDFTTLKETDDWAETWQDSKDFDEDDYDACIFWSVRIEEYKPQAKW